MLDVIILAIALSMDAFAVSIGLGSKARSKPHSLALIAALYFGVFQGLMPLIGYLGGSGALSLVGDYSHLIAFGLLLLIGGKMLFEGFQEGVEDEITMISQRILLTLAIATSIDALAAGFSLTLLPVNAFLACLIIASVTFVFSWAGVMMSGHLQKTSGSWLESRAEILGGLVLIGLAFKFLLL